MKYGRLRGSSARAAVPVPELDIEERYGWGSRRSGGRRRCYRWRKLPIFAFMHTRRCIVDRSEFGVLLSNTRRHRLGIAELERGRVPGPACSSCSACPGVGLRTAKKGGHAVLDEGFCPFCGEGLGELDVDFPAAVVWAKAGVGGGAVTELDVLAFSAVHGGADVEVGVHAGDVR